MFYFYIYKLENDGRTNYIKKSCFDIIKENLFDFVNRMNVNNILRYEIGLEFNNNIVFSYVIKNKEDLKNIKLFKSYGASGSGNFDELLPMSFGFIDLNRNIRFEYMDGKFKLYGIN